jgi:hypothetical protein
MPSSNLNSRFSTSTQTSDGNASWSNTDNALSDDGAVASVFIDEPTYSISNYLKLTERIQKIPSNATVDGIVVNVKLTNLPNCYFFLYVLKGATLSTEYNEQTPSYNFSIGGPTDKWGLSWTAADINATDFGVKIAFDSIGFDTDAFVDYMDTTVYYTYTETGDGTGRTTQGRRALFTAQTNSRVVT